MELDVPTPRAAGPPRATWCTAPQEGAVSVIKDHVSIRVAQMHPVKSLVPGSPLSATRTRKCTVGCMGSLVVAVPQTSRVPTGWPVLGSVEGPVQLKPSVLMPLQTNTYASMLVQCT